jgi:hypothetical protein
MKLWNDLIVTKQVLDLWTVYFNPRDYPGKYVARRFVVGAKGARATNDVFVEDSLIEIHALLPYGLLQCGRHETDDPCIIEVWL